MNNAKEEITPRQKDEYYFVPECAGQKGKAFSQREYSRRKAKMNMAKESRRKNRRTKP